MKSRNKDLLSRTLEQFFLFFSNIKECVQCVIHSRSSRFIAISVYYPVNKTTAEMVNVLYELGSPSQ